MKFLQSVICYSPNEIILLLINDCQTTFLRYFLKVLQVKVVKMKIYFRRSVNLFENRLAVFHGISMGDTDTCVLSAFNLDIGTYRPIRSEMYNDDVETDCERYN